jgi:hypothetical protein
MGGTILVTLMKRQKKPAEADPLTKAEAQIADLHEGLLKALAKIKELHFELEALAETPDNRAQQITDLRSAIAEAERQHTAQEAYASLIVGHAASEDLERLRVHIDELKRQLEAVESSHLKEHKERKDREATLRTELHTQEKTIADLDAKLRATLTVRERLQMERGQALLTECDTLLSDAETLEQDCKERYEQSKRVAATARANAHQRLEEYPSLRRELAARHHHHLRDDETSVTLELAVALLARLTNNAYGIDQAPAGLPIGVDVMLQEFSIEPDALQAASVGDVHSLMEKRNRLESVLRQYRRNLATV